MRVVGSDVYFYSTYVALDAEESKVNMDTTNKIYEVDVLEGTPTSERSTLVGKILSVLGNGKFIFHFQQG